VSWSDIPGWITFLSILPVLLVVVYLLVAWAIVFAQSIWAAAQ
jgi:hypothetical protein